jgi:hypothetical protein
MSSFSPRVLEALLGGVQPRAAALSTAGLKKVIA